MPSSSSSEQDASLRILTLDPIQKMDSISTSIPISDSDSDSNKTSPVIDPKTARRRDETMKEVVVPTHPIPSMQEPFAESMLDPPEASTPSIPRSKLGNAALRRQVLIDQEISEETHAARWKQKPGQRYHELWKLMSQISFGIYLLLNGLAKDDGQVMAILQGHVDEVDEFLETTLEDFDLARDDIEERLQFLKLPLENIVVFDAMLEDRNFRLQIVTGNERIEHIIQRTAAAMNDALKDVKQGLEACKEFTTYLTEEQEDGPWRQERPGMEKVFDAMKGNVEGWYKAYVSLQTTGNQLGVALVQLGSIVAEMDRRAGEVSRKTRFSTSLASLPVHPPPTSAPVRTSAHIRQSMLKILPSNPSIITPAIRATLPAFQLVQDRERTPEPIPESPSPVQSPHPTSPEPEPEPEYILAPRTYTPDPPRQERRQEPRAESRQELRAEPRQEPRAESRADPRREPRQESRQGSRQDLRAESRTESRAESRQGSRQGSRQDLRADLRSEPRRESRAGSREEARRESRLKPRQELRLLPVQYQPPNPSPQRLRKPTPQLALTPSPQPPEEPVQQAPTPETRQKSSIRNRFSLKRKDSPTPQQIPLKPPPPVSHSTYWGPRQRVHSSSPRTETIPHEQDPTPSVASPLSTIHDRSLNTPPSRGLDSAYCSDFDQPLSPPTGITSQLTKSVSNSPRLPPARLDNPPVILRDFAPSPRSEQQFFRPVQASPNSPLQRPWTAAPEFHHTHSNSNGSNGSRLNVSHAPTPSQLGNRRGAPSEMGMSMMSDMTLVTENGKKVKKKRSAFGWLKKAFALSQEEREAFEERKRKEEYHEYRAGYFEQKPQQKWLDGKRLK